MIRMAEICKRINEGPKMSHDVFDLDVVFMTARSLCEKYKIVYDPDTPVPSDDDLADRTFQAAIDFVVQVGVFCPDTKTVIKFSREEVLDAAANAPGRCIMGEGKAKTERALRFILAHDIHTMVPGFSTLEEVESAAEVGEEFTGLTKQEKKDMRFGELPLEPFCRECGLCTPCPDGLNIPLILGLDKYCTFHGITNWTKEVYERLNTRADSCTKCAKCEPKCPYKLPIIKMLSKAQARLGK